jgi:hypothetical protein
LRDELAVTKKAEHLVTEDELGLVGVDVGDGLPRAVSQEGADPHHADDVGRRGLNEAPCRALEREKAAAVASTSSRKAGILSQAARGGGDARGHAHESFRGRASSLTLARAASRSSQPAAGSWRKSRIT